MTRAGVLGLCAAVGLALGAAGAGTDDYPQRSVTIVVPFPAGGATDLLARLLATELRDKLKQPFVIENRPGAGTVIAASAVAKAVPDGYTLMLATTSTLAISPSVYKSIPFDPVKDFAPVALVGTTDLVLLGHPSVAADGVAGLIALMRSKPDAMSYATPGIGTPHHLVMEMFLATAGVKAQHVPYRGSPLALTDVVAGVVPLMMCDFTPALAMIQEKKVKVFGVAAPARSSLAPDLPTIAEGGLPGFGASGWFSVVAPAGTPRPIIDALNRVLTAYLVQPDVKDKLATLGMRPLVSTPEELGQYIVAERAKWAAIAEQAGITPQ
jgi:tripartite-type tricarboxylate transporter receptor subunit TctC